jgi:5-formyltetrahydrofolate cyclo-ligase
MSFYRVDSPDGPWITGAFGIREPADSGSERLFHASRVPDPFLVITPGFAFDRTGSRMGRGGGYYDKFFAALDSSHAAYYAVAFCLDCQIVREVPVDLFDKKVNAVCTATEFFVSL